MKEKTTYGLSPEILARLLSIGLQGSEARERARPNQTPVDVLRGMLARELPLDPAIPDSLPGVLNRPCDELLPAAGRAIGDLLINAETNLTVIKALRDYGKELRRRGEPKSKQEAAAAIYYAAIASALTFHGEKITQHSYGRLQEACARLEQKPWVPFELKVLFRKARAVCRRRRRKREQQQVP